MPEDWITIKPQRKEAAVQMACGQSGVRRLNQELQLTDSTVLCADLRAESRGSDPVDLGTLGIILQTLPQITGAVGFHRTGPL